MMSNLLDVVFEVASSPALAAVIMVTVTYALFARMMHYLQADRKSREAQPDIQSVPDEIDRLSASSAVLSERLSRVETQLGRDLAPLDLSETERSALVDRLRESIERAAHERTEHHVPPGDVDLPGLWTPAHRRAESGGRRGGRPQAVGNLAGERRRPCLRAGREIPTVPQRIIIIDNRVRTGLVPTMAAAGQCRSRSGGR